MQYVYKRPDGHYQFRYPIPADVRSYFPKGDGSQSQSHLIGSLETPDQLEANRRALVCFADFERKFSMLRDGAKSPHFAPFFRSLFQFELEQGRRRRATSDLSAGNLDFELRTLRNALEHPEPGELQAVAGWVVDHYFASSTNSFAAQIPDDTPLSDALLAAAAEVLLDVNTQLLAEAKGMVAFPKPRSPLLSEATEEKPTPGENLALSPEGRLSLAKYWEVHVKTKQGSSAPVSAHTLERRQSSWKEFYELLGPEKPLFKVTKAEVWRYRDALVKAPARAGSLKALRHLSFPERIEAMRLNPERYRNLDLNSVGDRLRQINAVFELAVTRGHIDRNPAQGVNEAKKDAEKARDPYSAEELQLIFSSPPFDSVQPPIFRTDEFWVPLLELFMGARASELYLRTIDVDLDHAVPHLKVVEYKERTLKNQSSSRALPIHPQLIELGFLEYCVHAKENWKELFPAWSFRKGQKPSEGPGRRRFNKHLKKLMPYRKDGMPADSHTFRHNFETVLSVAEGVTDRATNRLSGRAIPGSAQTYIHDLPIMHELAEAISKVRYRGLSLSHLKP